MVVIQKLLILNYVVIRDNFTTSLITGSKMSVGDCIQTTLSVMINSMLR